MDKLLSILFGFVRYLLIPGSIALELYFLLPAPARFSWRWLGIFSVLIILIEVTFWLQTQYFIRPIWHRCDIRKKVGWLLVACVFTLLLFAYASPNMVQVMEKFPFLAPEEIIEVDPILNSPDTSVEIWKVKIGDVRVPDSDLSLQGAWKKEGDRLWTSDPNARLTMNGKVPRYISLSFWRSPFAGQVLVRWDGKSKNIDLRGERKEEALFQFVFDLSSRKEPGLSIWIRFLTLPGWACLAFVASGAFYFEI